MTVIRLLTQMEFLEWLSKAVPTYAAEKVASGAWSDGTALELSRKEHETLLPAGKDTPGHYFYSILDDTGAQVGAIWFAAKDRGSDRVAYVYDVSVWPEHQRRGHAFRAFQAIESEVAQLGLAGIALHVFGHNTAAQALYAKLDYKPTNINLFKPVVADA